MNRQTSSVTLLELLIAIILLSVVVLAIGSIDLFSRFHVITADRRAQVQNEASYALEHMSKNIIRAIGNERVNQENTVVDIREDTGEGDDERIKVYIDASGDGIRQDEKNNPGANEDHWIAYRYYNNNNSNVSKRNSIEFCSLCRDKKKCNSCTTGWETVSIKANRVSGLVPTKPTPPTDNTLTDNYLQVEITTCWDPDGDPYFCGSPDNPTVNMRARIKMPSVSTN